MQFGPDRAKRVNMTSEEKWNQIVQSLDDKTYRDAFVAAEIETGIPFQIRAMRKARGWNQKQLAAAADMTQARISVLENADYEGAVNVKTLEKLASAFDVGLMVRFAAFSEIVDWTVGLAARSHTIPEYANDAGLRRAPATYIEQSGTVFMTGAGMPISFSNIALGDGFDIRGSTTGIIWSTTVPVTDVSSVTPSTPTLVSRKAA